MSIHVYEYKYHCIKKCHNRVNQNSNRSWTTERDRVEVGGLVDRCTYRLVCGSYYSINT